jgi:lipoprotein-releasing system ATP-binding protein
MNDTRAPQPTYGSHGLNLSDMPRASLPNIRVPLAAASASLRNEFAPLYASAGASLQPYAASQSVLQTLAGARNETSEILAAHYVRKYYRKASIVIPVLQGVELTIKEGEFISIIGPSGCGKTTLLHLLATLDAPDSGEVWFEGHRIDNLPSSGRDVLRNKYFGMVFQFYHLLPELTTLENVLTPAMIGEGVLGYWRRRRAYKERAREMLELVGLGHRLKHKPRELSGGEMQRTAIARALVARPRVLLADEPTGNLDKHTGEEIMEILRRLNREQNLTIVMVTHDPRIAAEADRTVTLVDGRVVAA